MTTLKNERDGATMGKQWKGYVAFCHEWVSTNMLGVIPHVCSGLFEEGQGHSFRNIGIALWEPRPASTAIVPCGFSVARVPSLALPQPRWLEALARSNTPCRVRTLGRRCSYGWPLGVAPTPVVRGHRPTARQCAVPGLAAVCFRWRPCGVAPISVA